MAVVTLKPISQARIVIPKRYVAFTPIDFPVFLVGPVQGGGDWQRSFIEHFITVSVRRWSKSFRAHALPRIKFIVSCDWTDDHPLATYFAGTYELVADSFEGFEASKTAWENEYLWNITERKGLVVFGLFPEDKENPRNDGLPYAFSTTLKIGRWTTVAANLGKQSILIGAHPGFIGLEIIRDTVKFAWEEDWIEDCWKDVVTPEIFADWVADEIKSLGVLRMN